MNALRPLLAAAALSAVAACNKKSSEVPPPPAQTPPAVAASQPAGAAAAAPVTAGEPFAGEVKLKAGVDAALLKPTDVLYLMARECAPNDCSKPGRLVAVQQHKSPALPLAFKIGPENVMVPGTPFTGPFLVQARIDRDGDAMTRGPDDLYAEINSGVKPGQTGIALEVAPLPPGTSPAPIGGAPAPGAADPHGAAADPHGAPAGEAMPAGHPPVGN